MGGTHSLKRKAVKSNHNFRRNWVRNGFTRKHDFPRKILLRHRKRLSDYKHLRFVNEGNSPGRRFLRVVDLSLGNKTFCVSGRAIFNIFIGLIMNKDFNNGTFVPLEGTSVGRDGD